MYATIMMLRRATTNRPLPAAELIVKEYGRDPFLILISCILSLRTKDPISLAASGRLFEYVRTPAAMVGMSVQSIADLIYPVGFYRKKAETIIHISHMIIDRYQGVVPSDEGALLALPGVGRKTMNLVRGVAFGIPSLCVDTHVHRIANRLGWIATNSPEETEIALKKIVPEQYWIELNTLFVMWGQSLCAPMSPWCTACPLQLVCQKVGVKKRR